MEEVNQVQDPESQRRVLGVQMQLEAGSTGCGGSEGPWVPGLPPASAGGSLLCWFPVAPTHFPGSPNPLINCELTPL